MSSTFLLFLVVAGVDILPPEAKIVRRQPSTAAFLFLLFISLTTTLGRVDATSSRWWSGASGGDVEDNDFRLVRYSELLNATGTFVYRAEGVTQFDRLLIDVGRHQVTVGARNYLLRLHLTNLSHLETLAWKADDMTTTICLAKGQTQADCHNYIRVLVLDGDRLLTCGTNAFSPTCVWRKPTRLSTVFGDRIPGVALCPYSPQQNNSALRTSSGDLYTATVTDFTARDPAIYRALGPSKYLRTVQYNTRWLNEPDFVSMYEIDDYVYVFFREVAIEYINCGKNVYSRVARICKSDSGGNNFLLEDNWTTFVKARLNCSLPGAYPFYFNELQSTYFSADDKLIYAVFTTSPTSIYASAVCVYNITAINRAFSGPYKYQADAQMAWARVPNSAPNEQCSAGSQSVDGSHQRLLVDAQKFQMMDSAVQGSSLRPLIVAEKERFTHIVLDRVKAADRYSFVDVMYIATLEGAVHKMAVLPTFSGDSDNAVDAVCLIETVYMTERPSPGYIHSLHFVSSLSSLLIGTTDSIYLVSTQRCSRFHSQQMCVAAQDPYCGWDNTMQRCQAIGNNNLSSCPRLTYPVDGNWSPWSTWLPCSYVEDATVDREERCLCRTRLCDHPRPQHGGHDCIGKNIEVSNCTVNGGWSSWALWSECSSSCGVGSTRSRRRSCTSPQPRFGGRLCVGEDVQFDDCNMPFCPTKALPPVNGQWSVWSSWTPCSSDCGRGFQWRSRRCDSPPPQNDGAPCLGNDIEWQQCHRDDCDEVRKSSEWSSWYRINSTIGVGKGGYREERYRCTCRADVTDGSLLRAPVIKTSARHCIDADSCDTAVTGSVHDIDGAWTSWSPWTVCSATCGIGGTQRRHRSCAAPRPSGAGQECRGPASESRSCNGHSCTGQWSCWSELSPCSVTCVGAGPLAGTRRRHRQCQYLTLDGARVATLCPGNDTEVLPCDGSTVLPCPDAAADDKSEADTWSSWSKCSPDGVQQRRQPCTSCEGNFRLQERACDNTNANSDNNGEPVVHQRVATDPPTTTAAVSIPYLVLSAAGGFILGVVTATVVIFCYRHHRQRRYDLNRFGEGRYQHRTTTAEPNHYGNIVTSKRPLPSPDRGYGSLDHGGEENGDLCGRSSSEGALHQSLTVADAAMKLRLWLESTESCRTMRTKLDSVDSELL